MEASKAQERGGYIDFSRVSPGELAGMASALVLLGSLWLPWFETNPDNPAAKINGATGEFTAWDTFGLLDWLLVAACTAPFILTWIVARGHALTWRPGEVTMIVGITAFVLILCNGIILGKPGGPDSEISISFGYFIGLLGCVGLLVAGYLRQALYSDVRKPPGVL